MLREWKLNYVPISGDDNGSVGFDKEEAGSVDLSIGEDFMVIPVFEQKPKHKYNRAKTKKEYQKIVDEDLEDWERDD